MDYMKSVPDKFFDLAVVDPPYGLDKKSTHGRGKLKDRCLNRGNIQRWDIRPSQEYFNELFRVSKNQVIWGGNYFDLPPTRCFVCWDKQQVWENFSQCEMAWTSFQKPAKHVTIPNRGGQSDKNKFHPTQKPVELYSYIFKTFAKQGDRILDTHLGSGSSRISAYHLGLDFYSTEIDKEYFDKQEERFRRECLEEIQTADGTVWVQQKLFD
ncbi:DNA methyltransferase [uncultured Bacteroides sp.]|uniref:DNA methyltransferase n=1 Tax=uncultured Bacteroides sp. TaxID=162156 RepID=UPI002639246C|nr:DNA methyltransferase [uncultured Bacteroides sp.]